MLAIQKTSDLHAQLVCELAARAQNVLDTKPLPRVHHSLGIVYHPTRTGRKGGLHQAYEASNMLMIDNMHRILESMHATAIRAHHAVEASLLLVERRHAFAMLTHHRVGKNTILGRLPTDMIERLFTDSTKIKGCTSGRYTKSRE
jgi:hypothetical protein